MFDNEVHIGFTGTRKGMGKQQEAGVTGFMLGIIALTMGRPVMDTPYIVAHHGDCIGETLHNLVRVKHDGLAYLDRNRKIVMASQYMLATPAEATMQARGGTWSTIRFAKEKKRSLVVFTEDED